MQHEMKMFGVVLKVVLVSMAVALCVLVPGPAPAEAQTTAPDRIDGVRFGDHGTFERAVTDTSTAGINPGSALPFTYSYRNGDWVVRVNLPTAGDTLTTDGAGLGRAISRYHVVRAPGTSGSLFVDFHLTGAAKSVKVYKLDNPGRIVVDVTPGGTALFPRPRIAANAVALTPRAGKLVGPGTFAVNGYARPFEARGAWRLRDASGRVVRQGAYSTNDWTEAWGFYAFSVAYPASLAGTPGWIEVGEFSPKDGLFRGVSVPVRFG